MVEDCCHGNSGSTLESSPTADIDVVMCLVQYSPSLSLLSHSEFVHEDQQVHLQPSPDPQATTYVNGTLLTATTTLHHVRTGGGGVVRVGGAIG